MNIKRFLAAFLALLMLLTLAACGGDSGNDAADTNDGIQTPDLPLVADDPTDAPTDAPDPTDPPAPAGLQYIVTVTDEGGNPIENAMIQMCEGTNCVPAKTDAEGKAVFTVQAEADFEVKFMALPAGFDYTTEEQVFHFEAGSKEMTIVLKAVA